MSNYNDIPVGLRVPASLPLDTKLWIKTSEDLENLGVGNNLAYTYYRGMRIYCADEKEIYEWMRVEDGNNLGLPNLPTSIFTYPTGYIVNDVNYSNDTYCFFKIPQAWDIVIPPPPEVPGVENVGSGEDIYKGLTGGNHQFRGITAEVTKPTNPGQINGTNDITFNAQVNGDNIEIKIDLSTLTVPLQQVGIPQFYVNSAADATIADGSIVRPYKTWEACRTAIIGSGSFSSPQSNGVKVIFQTDTTSAEDLTIRNVSYQFENNSIFKYIGSEDAVLDIHKLINASVTSSGHRIEGSGVIQVYTPTIGIKSGGDNNSSHYFHVAIGKGSNINIRERASNTQMTDGTFILSDTGLGGATTNSSGSSVYVLNKTGGNDTISANEGVISVVGHNNPVWETFQVEEGASLTISSAINRAISVRDGTLINYGSIIHSSTVGELGSSLYPIVRYGSISGSTGDIVNRYTPSTTVSLIRIEQTINENNAAGMNTSGSGVISGFLLGSTRQGGYNSIVELVGKSPSFIVSSSNSMTWNDSTRYNYGVYFSDIDTNGITKKVFSVNDIYTRVSFAEFIFGGVIGVTDVNTSLIVSEGNLENDSYLNKIKHSNLSGLNIQSIFTKIANQIYSSSVLNRIDNAAALLAGLKPGMWYYNTTIGALSIVQ